jgi:hypothetical protein
MIRIKFPAGEFLFMTALRLSQVQQLLLCWLIGDSLMAKQSQHEVYHPPITSAEAKNA